MKIAVTYEDGQIFQHFGHTAQFKVYETADGKILSSRIVDTNGSGHGALAGFLAAQGVDTLICGGIGGGADVYKRQERTYGVQVGGTAEAGFRYKVTGCMKKCGKGPCVKWDGDIHTGMTEEKLRKLIEGER